jgi:hypothetical protein
MRRRNHVNEPKSPLALTAKLQLTVNYEAKRIHTKMPDARKKTDPILLILSPMILENIPSHKISAKGSMGWRPFAFSR